MPETQHSRGAGTWTRAVRPAVAAGIGLTAAILSLVVFTCDVFLIVEVDEWMVLSFVLCGLGAGMGFTLFYRALPRSPLQSLFSGSEEIAVVPAPSIPLHSQVQEHHPDSLRPAAAIDLEQKPKFTRQGSHGQGVGRSMAPETGGLALIIIIGVCFILGGRMRGGWEFISLAVPAGVLVALFLSWVRGRARDTGMFSSIPVSGGVVGATVLAGIALVTARFQLLRGFLGLALAAGAIIALFLHRLHRRNQTISLT